MALRENFPCLSPLPSSQVQIPETSHHSLILIRGPLAQVFFSGYSWGVLARMGMLDVLTCNGKTARNKEISG